MDVSLKFSTSVETKLGKYGFGLEPLRADLIRYFGSNGLERPAYIGKDAQFERPDAVYDSEIHHLHLHIPGISCPKKWAKGRTTDSYLIYTYGDMNEEAYYVFGFIDDKAHEKCRLPQGHSLLTGFKVEAEKFRDNN